MTNSLSNSSADDNTIVDSTGLGHAALEIQLYVWPL